MAARYPRQHYHSRSVRSGSTKTSERERHAVANPTPPPDEYIKTFEACAATASYFLYAQSNLILSLHHDTLSVDRRFQMHRDEVLLIAADNVSEKGAGRLVVSYDASQTAIVWDLFTGGEVARFASFETIKVATWMRDGSIAFGNSQGAIILFEPSTSEHINTRTIFDPVTALAPASDCLTFAIGYHNGSILIATLQPSFTILHTLTTSRAPSPICGLSWHGSSSKQKTDMLATQTADGVLRVWSVAKAPHQEMPRTIRVLESTEIGNTSRNWFAWSKNGRLVNYADGDVRAWDVRTKKVTNVSVPVVDNVIAIAGYGPNGNLFTVSQNHGVQQYDLVHQDGPTRVKQAFHVPPNAPPTPPGSTEIDGQPRRVPVKPPSRGASSNIPIQIESDTSGVDTSEDEGPVLSPLQRIAKDPDDWADEERDQLAPLSPVSSRASMSSASSYGRPRRNRHRQPPSARSAGSGGSGGTVFSSASSDRSGTDSMSIRTGTSMTPSVASSRAPREKEKPRHKTMRSPTEAQHTRNMDLFPYTKARLTETKFRPPRYDEDDDLTPEILRREMLITIFGWRDDIEELIRDEHSRHPQGSASGVLLSKWLGDVEGDAASLVGSESMSSSDWMLLALSMQMGQGAQQKQIGQAFVRRLLETNEIHPAVAVLLGLGEQNEAVEIYVSRKFFMEAVLLTALCFPHDWGRLSHIVREWGEHAVMHSQPELAVRCFSCTAVEASDAWFSPKAQDLAFQASQALMTDTLHSPQSPPSAVSAGSNPNRLTAKNASLKLITSFGDKGEPKPQLKTSFGDTPIADTAVPNTPGGARRSGSRGFRDQSETRTATPGGFRRNRFPSATRQAEYDENPMPALPPQRRATPALSEMSEDPETTINARGPFAFGSKTSSRATSQDRNVHNLSIDTSTVGARSRTGTAASIASGDTSLNSVISRGRHRRTASSIARQKAYDLDVPTTDEDPISPALTTGDSMASYKGRSIDRYINSLDDANTHARQLRSETQSRGESRDGRSKSRTRQREPSAARSDFSLGGRARRSPTSPKSMTAEEAKPRRRQAAAEADAEPKSARPRASSKMSNSSRYRDESPQALPGTRSKPASRTGSRAAARRASPQSGDDDDFEPPTFRRQSPASPAAMAPRERRDKSNSRRPTPFDHRDRNRSSSRRPPQRYVDDLDEPTSPEATGEDEMDTRHGRSMSRKEAAAKELERRRLSLARRAGGTAPPIPEPVSYSAAGRPGMPPRSTSDTDILAADTFAAMQPPSRSATVDPEAMSRYSGRKASGSSVPMGLPATPKAMRNPKYDFSDGHVPAVPTLPDNLQTLSAVSYQPPPADDPNIQLLPSSVYNRPPISRSASAPPEKFMGRSGNTSPIRNSPVQAYRSHRDSGASQRSYRQQPPQQPTPQPTHESTRSSRVQKPRPSASSGMDQQHHQQQDTAYTHSFLDTSTEDPNIVIVPEAPPEDPPPVLAQLAHLAGPPPPPPPPPVFAQPPAPPESQHKPSQTHTYTQARSQSYDLGSSSAAAAGATHQQHTHTTSAGTIPISISSSSSQGGGGGNTKPQDFPAMHSLPPLTTQNLSLRSRQNTAPASAGGSYGGYGGGGGSNYGGGGSNYGGSNYGGGGNDRGTYGTAQTQDPNSSISGQSQNNISRWARMTDKVRSSSRSRNATRGTVERSPGGDVPQQQQGQQGMGQERSPYETYLPNMAFNRAKSPGTYSETGSTTGFNVRAPYETVYETGEERSERKERERERADRAERRPGTSGSQSGAGGMRNPKEIRAGIMGRSGF